ncbi:iron-sulfur cluster carrier protein ApbC (plasmid) [Halorubrum sp. BOL3-1]|uniref:Mrp/NBP35 family ATP-binding protein n=1 Tax=Halorubrum sp. BOL3-1 TaxID=2497325 RepID=UPI0010051D7E|nr:Mrp/NBP35 family ATP-binding protein [Halorubrum sp. BOL3-1]QAU14462.1 iron-sulfur cluster carrier protein ApbC [Halorubrum sp. BOL3-1]
MTTTNISDEDLRDRLRAVDDPALDTDIVSAGLVTDITVDGGTAAVELALGAPHAPDEAAIAERVREVADDAGIDVELSANVPLFDTAESSVLPGVKNVIAVASGKGGVGKSTVAVNLAAGLADRGANVGLFDADVYGPNVPQMLGADADPDVTTVDGEDRIEPPTAHGLKLMSVGLLIDDDDPVVWRGPVAQNTLTDLFDDVSWGSLDYLVVDLPPGTGDVQLTVLQNLPVTGTIIVTTPQSVAVKDTRRGVQMFGEYQANVLGVVENMSGFVCPNCGDTHDIFGEDGGQSLAEEVDVPYLGSLPLDPAIRMGADTGQPIVRRDTGETATAFQNLAATVANKVGVLRRHHQQQTFVEGNN